MVEATGCVRVPLTRGTVTFGTFVAFFHLAYYERAFPMNQVTEYEQGPVSRYQTAELELEHVRMLLTNLTTAACPYALGEEATDALIEAHREASGYLSLGCPNCLTRKYLMEGITQ